MEPIERGKESKSFKRVVFAGIFIITGIGATFFVSDIYEQKMYLSLVSALLITWLNYLLKLSVDPLFKIVENLFNYIKYTARSSFDEDRAEEYINDARKVILNKRGMVFFGALGFMLSSGMSIYLLTCAVINIMTQPASWITVVYIVVVIPLHGLLIFLFITKNVHAWFGKLGVFITKKDDLNRIRNVMSEDMDEE